MPRHSKRNLLNLAPWEKNRLHLSNRPPYNSKLGKRITVNSKKLKDARKKAKELGTNAKSAEHNEWLDRTPFNLSSKKYKKSYDSPPKGRIENWTQYLRSTWLARLIGFKPDPINNEMGYEYNNDNNDNNDKNDNMPEVNPYVQEAANKALQETGSIEEARDAARRAQKIVNKIYRQEQRSISNYNYNGGSKRKHRTKRKKKPKKMSKKKSKKYR